MKTLVRLAVVLLALALLAWAMLSPSAACDITLPVSSENIPPASVSVPNPGCTNNLPYPLQMSGESTATDFTRWEATDLDGATVTQEILKGSRLTVVSAWSSWCGTCIRDLKALQKIYEAYSREDLNVIGIVASGQDREGKISQEEIAIVRQLQERTGAEFLQLMPSDDLIAIKLKDLGQVPEFFLLDAQGKSVGESLLGGQSVSQLTDWIESAFDILEQEESIS